MSRPILRFPAARTGCRLVRSDLPDGFLEWRPMATWMDIHLETCLACQADLGPNRAVADLVADVADPATVRAPEDLVEDVMAGLDRPTESELRRRRSAIGWSAGAVSAAVATTVVVAVARSRTVGAH